RDIVDVVAVACRGEEVVHALVVLELRIAPGPVPPIPASPPVRQALWGPGRGCWVTVGPVGRFAPERVGDARVAVRLDEHRLRLVVSALYALYSVQNEPARPRGQDSHTLAHNGRV